MDVIYVSYSYRCNKTLMKDKFYSRVAVMIMTVIWQMVSITALAQRQVQVVEMQTQPDGTQIYVPKTIEVPEKSSEEVAAAKSKAATVTAEDDDLQYYLNHLPMTRAGESAIVIDLSTFKDTIRQTTLEVNQGISLKFTNGAIRRGTGLAKDDPMIRISNGTIVEFDETVTISGENLETNGEAVLLYGASLKTAAWIGNTKRGTEPYYYHCIYACLSSSKLEVLGGTIDGWAGYEGTEPLVISGGKHSWIVPYSSDAVISGKNTEISEISFYENTYKLYLKSSVKYLRFHDYFNVISDGYAVATGYDGYQLTEDDMQKIKVTNRNTSVNDLNDYEKRLEGNSIVMRKIVKDLQSDINNAPDNTETTIDLDNYGELTTGILIPKGKKIKMTGTKNVTLASNFTGDYIFRTEGDAQLDITISGLDCKSCASIPKKAFVAGYPNSKMYIRESDDSFIYYPYNILYTEKGGTIYCYADIRKTTFYNSAGGTMYIDCHHEGEVLDPTAEAGSTTNITGNLALYGTFTAEGKVSMWGNSISSLTNLVLGKNSSVTFTTNVTDAKNLIASFKNNDYVLDRPYVNFLKNSYRIRFSLLDGHTPTIDNCKGEDGNYRPCICIVEYDKEKNEMRLDSLASVFNMLRDSIEDCIKKSSELRIAIEENKSNGTLTAEKYEEFVKREAGIDASITKVGYTIKTIRAEIVSTKEDGYYGETEIAGLEANASYLYYEIKIIEEYIASLQSDLDATLASHKKTFTNTDDLQDFLNNLGKNNETTEDNPATVTIADGTVLDNFEIPEGTHVEMNVEGDSNDDLQAFINGLVTVKYGSSLRLNGNYVVRGENTSATLLVHGTIDIYATIILEGTKTEVVHIYNGGTANWRGNMTSGKIVNEGTLNIYSGTTHYIENHGTVHHNTGVCHHIVNYRTYYMKGGNINASNTEYDNAFENCGTAYLTGGTIVSSKTLIINYVNSKTYIDGVKLDDSNATSTIISYSDFHIRGDYSPKHIILDRGVRINFTSVWTVRWHITFIDNRTTIRKVIFHSDKFNLNNDYIKLIDFNLPDGYRWYYNAEEKGIEMRDSKVYDSDDLQAFLDRLAKFAGTASEPVILEGDNHTIDVETDADRLFELPANSYVEIRNVIFRIVSDVSQKRWHIPSGSTLILNNVTLNAGEEKEDDDRVELAVEGGKLYINNVVFINIRLTLNGTVYVCSPLSSRIYLSYENNDEIVNGVHVAEGCNGYVLTEADLDKFVYCDLDDSSDIWKFLLAENAIELYQEVSGMEKVPGDNHPQVFADEAGRLNIIGVPQDAQCFIYNSEGILIRKGTVSEITASGSIPAKGCYVLKVGKTAIKFVR